MRRRRKTPCSVAIRCSEAARLEWSAAGMTMSSFVTRCLMCHSYLRVGSYSCVEVMTGKSRWFIWGQAAHLERCAAGVTTSFSRIYIYICMYTYIYICIYLHIHIYICKQLSVCVIHAWSRWLVRVCDSSEERRRICSGASLGWCRCFP